VTFPFFDCYTGPYWSDGKWQGSTARGSCKPKSRLDELSREHDASFALCTDLDCLDRADELYYQKSRDMSLVPRVIGAMPLYGNKLGRMAARMMGMEYVGAESGGANKGKMGDVVVYHPTMEESNIPPDGFCPVADKPNAFGGQYLPNGTFRDSTKQRFAIPNALPAADTPPVMNTKVPQLKLPVSEYTNENVSEGVRRGRGKIWNEWLYWGQQSHKGKKKPKFYEMRRQRTVYCSPPQC